MESHSQYRVVRSLLRQLLELDKIPGFTGTRLGQESRASLEDKPVEKESVDSLVRDKVLEIVVGFDLLGDKLSRFRRERQNSVDDVVDGAQARPSPRESTNLFRSQSADAPPRGGTGEDIDGGTIFASLYDTLLPRSLQADPREIGSPSQFPSPPIATDSRQGPAPLHYFQSFRFHLH